MRRLWVIEDGKEYVDFARLFLCEGFELSSAHGWAEVEALLAHAGHRTAAHRTGRGRGRRRDATEAAQQRSARHELL